MKQKSVDVWDVFLNTLENRGLSSGDWEIAPDVQEELITYFKTKIDAGIVDGQTDLPSDLVWNEYVWRFPEEMRQKLQAHAESALKADPDNGAAAKFLAIIAAGTSYDIPFDAFWHLSEKAMTLLPSDVELCYLAFEKSGIDPLYFEKAVVALERLFERHCRSRKPTLYQWIYRFCYDYLHVTTRPNEFYMQLESEDPLTERWRVALERIQAVLEKQLEQSPDDWNTLRMLSEIHEALGNSEMAQAAFKKAQPVFEKRLEQDPKDWMGLNGLANIHEKLGNLELAREYKIRKDPTLTWEGQVLPDFSSTVDLEGEPISLADYRGKVILLDFWAVWCGPCIGEIENVKMVFEKYHDKGFEVIGISLDTDEATLREFAKENQLPWRQIFDGQKWDGPLVKKYGVRSIPAPFLINQKGKVISVKARGNLLSELVEGQIKGKKT